MKQIYYEELGEEIKKSRELRKKIKALKEKNTALTKQLFHIIGIYKKLV